MYVRWIARQAQQRATGVQFSKRTGSRCKSNKGVDSVEKRVDAARKLSRHAMCCLLVYSTRRGGRGNKQMKQKVAA